MVIKRLHNGIGIIDGGQIPEGISVVPLFHFFKIAAVVRTELLHFRFGKSHVCCKLSWLNHGIFPEIRYG